MSDITPETPILDPPDVPIICAGPGPHDPTDGIIGWAQGLIVPAGSPPYTTGMVCAAPGCQPTPTPDPVDVATQLAELLDAIRSATSLTDLQARIVEGNL